MASHASSWAGVAASKTSPNHARVAGENRLNALVFFTPTILPGAADSFHEPPRGPGVADREQALSVRCAKCPPRLE
ncbi:hypothetical protein GCM10009804_08170 [Kribbella hippodromi]|uniref:Uncharacterized protein n=1 Tax=Kribbella hippodromi TaxID=434347 RepID=A0ABP4N394_9ACTN